METTPQRSQWTSLGWWCLSLLMLCSPLGIQAGSGPQFEVSVAPEAECARPGDLLSISIAIHNTGAERLVADFDAQPWRCCAISISGDADAANDSAPPGPEFLEGLQMGRPKAIEPGDQIVIRQLLNAHISTLLLSGKTTFQCRIGLARQNEGVARAMGAFTVSFSESAKPSRTTQCTLSTINATSAENFAQSPACWKLIAIIEAAACKGLFLSRQEHLLCKEECFKIAAILYSIYLSPALAQIEKRSAFDELELLMSVAESQLILDENRRQLRKTIAVLGASFRPDASSTIAPAQ